MKYQGRVLSKLLLLGLICQLPAYGQFSKYRSRSKFKPQQVQPLPPHMRGETAPSPEEVEEMNEDIAEEDLSEEDESESEELSDKSYNPGASDSNAKTFGNRNTPMAPSPDSKYVTLNPETAFGPEVVQSFGI